MAGRNAQLLLRMLRERIRKLLMQPQQQLICLLLAPLLFLLGNLFLCFYRIAKTATGGVKEV